MIKSPSAAFLGYCAPLLLALAGTSHARAAAAETPSPVAPAAAQPPPKPAAVKAPTAEAEETGTYELRGFFEPKDKLEVSLRRVGTEKSVWLTVGEKSGDLLIEKADREAGTALLLAGKRRTLLRLAGESTPISEQEARLDRARRYKLYREKVNAGHSPERQEASDKAWLEACHKYGAQIDKIEMKYFKGTGIDELEDDDRLGKSLIFNKIGKKTMDEYSAEVEKIEIQMEAYTERALEGFPLKNGELVPVPEDYEQMRLENMEDERNKLIKEEKEKGTITRTGYIVTPEVAEQLNILGEMD